MARRFTAFFAVKNLYPRETAKSRVRAENGPRGTSNRGVTYVTGTFPWMKRCLQVSPLVIQEAMEWFIAVRRLPPPL